jgi:hypothetical protein
MNMAALVRCQTEIHALFGGCIVVLYLRTQQSKIPPDVTGCLRNGTKGRDYVAISGGATWQCSNKVGRQKTCSPARRSLIGGM